MNQFALKTKWVALAFAVMSLFAAYIVAGNTSGGTAPDVTEQPQAEPEQVAQASAEAPPPPVEDTADDTEFVDDGELIDDAGGEDPSPPDDSGGDGSDSGDGDFAAAS